MAYNWAQLAFVEKWRLNAVRGPLIGMYRPEGKTLFDLRLRPGEGGVGPLPGPVEVHLVDAGDLIREKKLPLTSTVAVVIRLVASEIGTADTAPSQAPPVGRGRRWLEAGTKVTGTVLQGEEDTLLLDVGMPVLVQLPGGNEGFRPSSGQMVEVLISETPKGFLVV
jgi:hypothetical protein